MKIPLLIKNMETKIKNIALKFIRINGGNLHKNKLHVPPNFDINGLIKTYSKNILVLLKINLIRVNFPLNKKENLKYFFDDSGNLIKQKSIFNEINFYYNKKGLLVKKEETSNHRLKIYGNFLNRETLDKYFHKPLYNFDEDGLVLYTYNSKNELIRTVSIPDKKNSIYGEKWFLNNKIVKNKEFLTRHNFLPNSYRTFIFKISYWLYKYKIWRYSKFIKTNKDNAKRFNFYI